MKRLVYNRRGLKRLAAVAALAAAIFCRPASLIGEGENTQAAKEHRIAKIRSALELQEIKMSAPALNSLARSVMSASERHGMDPMLVLAIIKVESQFNDKARSPQGARGLMQVQPAAVTALVEAGKIPRARSRDVKLTDPAHNVAIGVSYLALMKENFGDLKLALTAYNSGPTWLSKKLEAREEIPSEYATKVLATQRAMENRLARNDAATLHADHSNDDGEVNPSV